MPVLTAHPTEVQRKSTLSLHRDISQSLAGLDAETAATLHEQQQSRQRLAGLIMTLWQTRLLRRQRLTVLDEIDNVLSYYESTFLPAIPRLYQDLAYRLQRPGRPVFELYTTELPPFIDRKSKRLNSS